MRAALSLFACVGFVGLAGLYAPDAHACGGCLIPPGEQNTVVTDHRMILSVSKVQSTLYDQIQYSGNPKEFAWVLPISGTVDVGLSADSMFNALNTLSAVTVLEPPRNCPPPPVCPANESDSFGAAKGGSTSADAGAAPPIDVLKKETVGPYETVQLKVNVDEGGSPQALQTWLADNGFNVPADVQPIISQYVTEKFNFLALKLKPGETTQSMRPVRVTTQGASAQLPLRMVAAGTGANVGITLWVVSEGRYEPQNFPSFIIKDEDLVWDWNTGTSNFKALRAERSAAAPGKTWEVESSIVINRNQVENSVRNGGFGFGGGPQQSGGDYLPIEDANGNQTKSAELVRSEDLTTVFKGIANGVEHLTRMRADLAKAALATDLSIVASQDQSLIPILRNPKKENGQPQCPVFDGNCNQTGTLPRDQAALRAGSSDPTFTCATTQRTDLGLGSYGAVGAFLGLTLVRAARNRRKQSRF
jgi:hypothetical protein